MHILLANASHEVSLQNEVNPIMGAWMDELVEIARFCFGLGPSDRATQQEDEDAEWEETQRQMAAAKAKKKAGRNTPPSWTPGGSVDGRPAKTRQDGDRLEALWGGAHPEGDGEGHGHIITNDGLNAASIRYPGEDKDAFNNPEDRRRR